MASGAVKANDAERTVLTYVKLHFRGSWESYPGPDEFRPVDDKAELLVVTEAPTGTLVTHWFIVRRRPDPPNVIWMSDSVRVPREENIVYIPERCVKRAPGDHTTCSKK